MYNKGSIERLQCRHKNEVLYITNYKYEYHYAAALWLAKILNLSN